MARRPNKMSRLSGEFSCHENPSCYPCPYCWSINAAYETKSEEIKLLSRTMAPTTIALVILIKMKIGKCGAE